MAASRAASQRSQRRLRAVLAGLAGLLALALVAGDRARARAARKRRAGERAAQALRLGARALVEDDLDLSLLLARQGVALEDSPQTRANLLAALLKSPAAIGVVRGDGDRLVALDLSADQSGLHGQRRHADLRRPQHPARGGAERDVPGQDGITDAVRRDDLQFSPDGAWLVVGGTEPVVLDARSHRVLARLPRAPGRVRLRGALLTRRAHATRRDRRAAEGVTSIRRFDARTGEPRSAAGG